MKEIQQKYHNWLEEILAGDLPEGIRGFAINLYEGVDSFGAELIASPNFDPEDEDWACDEIFMSDKFEFSHKYVSSGWESALKIISESTRHYIENGSKGAVQLSLAQGVGVGFVDGDIILVHENS